MENSTHVHVCFAKNVHPHQHCLPAVCWLPLTVESGIEERRRRRYIDLYIVLFNILLACPSKVRHSLCYLETVKMLHLYRALLMIFSLFMFTVMNKMCFVKYLINVHIIEQPCSFWQDLVLTLCYNRAQCERHRLVASLRWRRTRRWDNEYFSNS